MSDESNRDWQREISALFLNEGDVFSLDAAKDAIRQLMQYATGHTLADCAARGADEDARGLPRRQMLSFARETDGVRPVSRDEYPLTVRPMPDGEREDALLEALRNASFGFETPCHGHKVTLEHPVSIGGGSVGWRGVACADCAATYTVGYRISKPESSVVRLYIETESAPPPDCWPPAPET